MNYIVLSGVSGGMGMATAKKLIEAGFHVFGLDIKKPQEQPEGLTFIETDIRDSVSINNALLKVKEETNEIDAIVSMAGINDVNSLLEISEEDFIKIFDINVFGAYRLNKAFVSLLKERGKVIIISSELAPLDPLPYIGLYAITKSTLDKYAYSLRMELQLLNKQVVVIRPGAVNTPILEASAKRIDEYSQETELYKYNASKFRDVTNSVQSKNIPPEKIGKLVLKILKKKKPKYTYHINRNFGLMVLNAMPQRFQNWIIKKILKAKNNSLNRVFFNFVMLAH